MCFHVPIYHEVNMSFLKIENDARSSPVGWVKQFLFMGNLYAFFQEIGKYGIRLM